MYIYIYINVYSLWFLMWVVAIGAVGDGDGGAAAAGAAARYPNTKDRSCPSLVFGFWPKMVWGGGSVFGLLGFWVLGRRSCCCCN